MESGGGLYACNLGREQANGCLCRECDRENENDHGPGACGCPGKGGEVPVTNRIRH
jgi:hypothetical protein